jgi:hypothetical protein
VVTGAIEAAFLFQLDMRICGVETIGVTPHGPRIISYLKGRFEGPGLKGTVENGADYILLRADKVAELDARLTLRTDTGEFIYLHYSGVTDIPEEAGDAAAAGILPPGKFKPRVAVRLETASSQHARLNQIQAMGIGQADTVAGTVGYRVYAL